MDNTVKEKKKPLTRFGEFELLKAIAILGLPAVHLMEMTIDYGYAAPELQGLKNSVIGLCAFGPSVFMMCMGFGIGGGKTPPQKVRKQGVQFILIGVLLNILRFIIPGAVGCLLADYNFMDFVDFSLQSDIYYFVGIFFLFYSLMLQFKVKTPDLITICIFMLTVNTLLTPVLHGNVTNRYLASVIGNIVYVDDTSCFPLLSWAIFPTVGILLGEILKKTDEERRAVLMRTSLFASAAVFISYVVFLKAYGQDVYKIFVSPLNAYITDIPNVVLLISIALVLISLTYYLCKLIGASKFMEFMLRISTFIIPFYMFQWVLVVWLSAIVGAIFDPSPVINCFWFAVITVVVTAICVFVSTKFGMKIMKMVLKLTSPDKWFKKKKKKTAKAEVK